MDVAAANQTVNIALSGASLGLLHDEGSREDVPITIRLSREDRSGIEQLSQLQLRNHSGTLVPLRELVRPLEIEPDKTIYHKNLMPV
ncbi:efflux RND transporter permease subunit, partial [Salmonella enterica]|uniref:efflux RND transporter permease subunit n=1 Tax=Salmonella enterica TaxID=28901 RepID=UPI003D2E90F9